MVTVTGMCEPPADRLPFGRKRRERIEDAATGLVLHVHEQRDRRLDLSARSEREHLLRVRRPFHQNDIRFELLERGQQAAR